MKDIADLQKQIKSFCEDRDWDQFHGAKDLAIGTVTEASELLEIFRFLTEKESEALMSSEKRRAVEEELADVLFFILRFSEKYKIDLHEAFGKKMEKNAEKYPVELSRSSNKKYTEFSKTDP